MASIKLNNYEIFSQTGTDAPKLNSSTGLNFDTTNHSFTIKGVDAPIVGANYSTSDDANSGQLAIYNGDTKLWGINENGWTVTPNRPYAFVTPTETGTYTDIFDIDGIANFNVINESNGNHYDTTNYRFNCPIEGLYSVSAHFLSDSNTDLGYTQIYKNGAIYTRAYTVYRGFKISHIIKCSAGDYLQVGLSNGAETVYTGVNDLKNSAAHYCLIG